MISLTMNLLDFLEARIVRVGMRNVETFCSELGMGKPTFKRVWTGSASRATLQRVAIALQFRHWDDLVDAWKKDDVGRALDVAQPPSPEIRVRHFTPGQHLVLTPELARMLNQWAKKESDENRN